MTHKIFKTYMKHYISSFCALCLLCTLCAPAHAQWIRVWQGEESTRYAISDATAIPYSTAGSTLTIGGDTYSTAAIDSITVVYPVTITWSGETASVDIPESVEGVTATVTGGNVVITNTNISNEQEFILSGTSTAGSLTYNGEFKCKFHLAGLDLTSTQGAAIDIQCGKRIDLILQDGTVNTLADAANGTQKAALNCQGHMEISGGGMLSIAGNTNHALRCNEYLLLKKSAGSIIVTKAAADGIHCGEFFQMNGGAITISGMAADGLQVETDATSDEEQNGRFIMNDGSIDVTMTAEDTKGIRLDADETDTSIIPEMYLYGGAVTVNVTKTSLGGKAIDCEGNITIGSSTTSPTVNLTVAAGRFEDSDGETSRATGLKAEGDILIASGATTIKASGKKSRGVKAASLTATGGSLTIAATGSGSYAYNSESASTGYTYVQNGGTIKITY